MSIEGEVFRLKQELAAAGQLDVNELAEGLKNYTFSCRRCASCCQNACGDNTVALFPGEVRRIMEFTGLDWLDIAAPPESDVYDMGGRRHAFEWVLKKTPGGDCIFLEGGSCKIYDVRPCICQTYPFSFDGRDIQAYLCDGIETNDRTDNDLNELASSLKERYVREIQESLQLFEKYEPFEPGTASDSDIVILHDSEGTKQLREKNGVTEFL